MRRIMVRNIPNLLDAINILEVMLPDGHNFLEYIEQLKEMAEFGDDCWDAHHA